MRRLRQPKPQPASIFRSWPDPAGGEERWAVHPLYLAMIDYYAPQGDLVSRLHAIESWLREIARGQRRLPEQVATDALEIDRLQRDNGADDENVAGLVESLQGAWTA